MNTAPPHWQKSWQNSMTVMQTTRTIILNTAEHFDSRDLHLLFSVTLSSLLLDKLLRLEFKIKLGNYSWTRMGLIPGKGLCCSLNAVLCLAWLHARANR
jgi:hypothetical protein